MKDKITIKQIIAEVSQTLRGMDAAEALADVCLIRTALNDAVDAAVKERRMTEAQANNWSQERAVKKVQLNLENNLREDIAAALGRLNKRHP